jgi:hypothetical protein
MRAFGYTPEFGARVALPELGPGWAPGGGLLAVEFVMQRSRGALPLYSCVFNLYVDSRLDVWTPENGLSGTDVLYFADRHAFLAGERDTRLNKADHTAYWERRRAFGMSGLIATPDYVPGKRGAASSTMIQEYVRDLLPGVTYLRVTGCAFADWKDAAPGVNVWVKKRGGKDYTRGGAIDPAEFHQLPLPQTLLEKVRPWAEWSLRSGSVVLDKYPLRPREKAN